MRVYYLSEPLSASELAELEDPLDWSIELVRVPYLLPAAKLIDGVERVSSVHDAPIAPLKAVGILKYYGQRTALAPFCSHHCTAEFVDPVARLTGRWPYLIQAEKVRNEIGDPGELRILDLDEPMRA